MIGDVILSAGVLGALYGTTPGSGLFITGLALAVYLILRTVAGWRNAVPHRPYPPARPGRRSDTPPRTVRCGRTNRR